MFEKCSSCGAKKVKYFIYVAAAASGPNSLDTRRKFADGIIKICKKYCGLTDEILVEDAIEVEMLKMRSPHYKKPENPLNKE